MRLIVRCLLAVFFILVGQMHFTKPKGFAKIVPPPLPPMPCVYLSGAVEMIGGVGLLFWPKPAGWLLIYLLIAVFPANIYMAVAKIRIGGIPPKLWMNWARLPMQPLLATIVWWAAC